MVEETLFLGVGDEAHLKEDGGTCRFEKYPEGGLSHAAVFPIEVSDETFLHLLGKTQGLIHIAVLHQLEHDIGVDGVRIEALVGRFIIRLEFHHGVLAHRHVEVLLHFLGSEDKGLHTTWRFVLRRVRMDGDKEIGVILVGNIRAGLQRNKDIRRACINDVDIGVLLVEFLADLEHQFEVEIFLLGEFPDRSGVFASVTRIQNNRILFLRRQRQNEERKECYKEIFSHIKPI